MRRRAAVRHEGGTFGATKRGGKIPWGDVPARPFMGISDDDRSAILDIIRKHLAEG
ncbi:phage virion morphogenesis protein [Tepidimonas sp.]|uniref:phage virion morphogenesis protein n=1 Tax=Tepidimonas sp. TaxID=2002775 RepID=UPI00391FA741